MLTGNEVLSSLAGRREADDGLLALRIPAGLVEADVEVDRLRDPLDGQVAGKPVGTGARLDDRCGREFNGLVIEHIEEIGAAHVVVEIVYPRIDARRDEDPPPVR